MKPDQIEKRLSWLDEQRRKEADLINLMEGRLEEALKGVEKQERQIKELSSEVIRLSAVASQIRQFDDVLGKQRDDFSKRLADSQQLYAEKQHHIEDLRKLDYEAIAKSVSQMKVKFQEFDQIKESLEARKLEETRLARGIAQIDEKLESMINKSDEQSRALHTIEESKKIDTRRIADLQSESTELRLKLDTVRGKQDSLEDRIRRTETRIEDIATSEAERRDIYTLWEEKQELRMVEFEKNWKEWQVKFEDFQKKAIEVDEKIHKYDENYRALSKTRSDLDKLIDRLERRITEISEMQRIGEERIKQEWSSFQADEQKRWNTYKLTNDEMWREHSRIHDKITAELQVVNDQLNEGLESLQELAEKSQNRVIDLLNTVKVWADEINKRVSEVR
ncbi:MAG: hypothetical protein A2Z14_16180 [Chloroflexi bacterium RBG_16_48_8]|nr:MAG: hypothetical protein A2Z14_16180 [Chloroflexi bacterium RBG_16_48_8]